MRKCVLALAATAALGAAAGSSRGVIVINEIDSDTVNSPSTDHAEFIELFSTTGTTTSLAGYTLVLFNGNGDVSYRAIDLDPFSTDAGGYFLFGTNSVAGADDTSFLGAGNILQNGPDAVALYTGDATSFPNGTAPTTTNLVDAIVYGTNDPDDPGLRAALGESTQYDEGPDATTSAANSLARFPNGTGDFESQAPTPGASNGVPEPASLGLLALGGLLLARCRK